MLAARERGLAGATVIRGPMGYGASSRLHTAKILRLSEDLPLIVEIVDSEEKIQAFLPVLDTMVTASGLVTLEKVQVIRYGAAPTATRRRLGQGEAADPTPFALASVGSALRLTQPTASASAAPAA